MGVMRINIVVFCMLFGLNQATDSRGGTISWKHYGSVGNTHDVEFYFRLGWTRNFSSPSCDDNMISDQISSYDIVFWYIYLQDVDYPYDYYFDDDGLRITTYAKDFPHSAAIKCTAYDPYENWAYGYNSFRTNITTTATFKVGHAGYFSTDSIGFFYWYTYVNDIDLSIRSDTGKVNHPPSSFSSPVVRLQQGCPETIQIHAVDEDNDIVRCRYANGDAECYPECIEYEHFTLGSVPCTIFYDGGGGIYDFPLSIRIMDSPRQNVTLTRGNRLVTPIDHFGSIPLNFMVKVFAATSACNALPTYPSFAIPEDQVFTIPNEGTLQEVLYAYPSSESVEITHFIILGPLGVLSSPVYKYAENIYATNMSWSPTPDQTGTHQFCYYAVDESIKYGKQRCFVVVIGEIANPCDVENGGCSDLCVPSGSISTCACTRQCWRLATDRKTCIPLMEVTCTGENIVISVATCSTNTTIAAGSSVSASNQNTCKSINQGSDHVLNFSPLECSVIIKSNPIEVQYLMSIWIWEGETYGQGPSAITRGLWKSIPASCSLASTTNVTGAFVPILPLDDEFVPKNIVIEGLGSFTLYFEFYRGKDFLSAYSPLDFPLEVTVNDDIYFSLGAVGRGNLIFFTEECVAQTTPTLTADTLQYTFIKDGCLIDTTTTQYESSNPMQNRFSIKAFEFENRLVATRQNHDIYLQCKVMLCDAAENNTRCAQLCVSNKRKRRAENVDETPGKSSLFESPPQDVSNQFRLIIDSDEDETEEYGDNYNKASSKHYSLILLGIGVLLSRNTLLFE